MTPVLRVQAEKENKQMERATEKIRKYLEKRMEPDKAYSHREINKMIDSLAIIAPGGAKVASLIPRVDWYEEFVDDFLEPLRTSSGETYYTIKRK